MNEDIIPTRGSKLLRISAVAWVIINGLGAPLAIAMGEPMHAATHIFLLFGGYVAWQFVPRGRKEAPVELGEPDPKLEYLQQSVDAIAVEVERIGEAQRFTEKLRAEQREPPSQK
ncbi:MAG: hypothetical protein ABR582_01605 [Gemmatimonadaceae bacterium]